jgi:lipopolysaccharide exporter
LNKIKKTFKNLKSTEGTLSQKVFRSGFWVFSLRIINRGFSLLRLIILARLLSPNDFGLMGIALLTMSIMETFTQTGFQQALIQKREDIKSYLDSAWTFLILRGLFLYIILYLLAPYAAIFFDTPKAGPIIRAIGVLLIFKAFTNIGIIYFKKELEFSKEFIYQFSGTIVDFIVAVVAVLTLRNVWALVLGHLAGSFIRFIVSYFVHPYKPKINIDFVKAKELFRFGKWIMGSSILVFLITQGDDIFVGKFLGATALGFYQLAYRISNMPATEITHVISQVTFPAYSKLQDNKPKLREAYLKVLQLTAFLSFPIAGLIFILAPDFTKIFLGEKWMPMVPAMQVLAFAGLARSIMATTGPIFHGVGKPKVETGWQIVRFSIILIFIFPFTIKWDIFGTSIIVLLSAFISTIGFIYSTIIIINGKIIKFIKVIILPTITLIFMILTLSLIKIILYDIEILHFFLLVIVGLLVLIIMTYLYDKYLNYNMKSLLMTNR